GEPDLLTDRSVINPGDNREQRRHSNETSATAALAAAQGSASGRDRGRRARGVRRARLRRRQAYRRGAPRGRDQGDTLPLLRQQRSAVQGGGTGDDRAGDRS